MYQNVPGTVLCPGIAQVQLLCRAKLRTSLRAWTTRVHGLRNLQRGYLLLQLVQARTRAQVHPQLGRVDSVLADI